LTWDIRARKLKWWPVGTNNGKRYVILDVHIVNGFHEEICNYYAWPRCTYDSLEAVVSLRPEGIKHAFRIEAWFNTLANIPSLHSPVMSV
jgi:hypothetical protein